MGSVTVSVVSHLHGAYLPALLDSLALCPEIDTLILTSNLPEDEPEIPADFLGRVVRVRNAQPVGFGANHNAAFALCKTPYFAVLNPDIRFDRDPFPSLLSALRVPGCALAAPAVVSPLGLCEDSARDFPSPFGILAKMLGRHDGRVEYSLGGASIHPDWVAGMFMFFSSSAFASVGGFDERFFLYYEDVDVCARLRRSGYSVILDPECAVVHDAQRSSRRSLRFLSWHVQSLLRFWFKHLGRFPGRAR